MDYKASLRSMSRPRKRKPQIRLWKMKKQEEKDAYTLAVMQKTLSDVGNLDWQEINQILVETAKEVWKRDIHRERDLVVARRNSESSGLKKSNIQAVPDEQE